MFICVVSVVLATARAVDVRAQAASLPRAKGSSAESLLELQSSWAQKADRSEGPEMPASLLRSERRTAVVSEQGEISSDDGISIEDLLKDEVVKQEKAAEELMNVPKVVGCAGTEKGDVPHGFTFPENYPADPAWDVKSIWNSNKAGTLWPSSAKRQICSCHSGGATTQWRVLLLGVWGRALRPWNQVEFAPERL